jgi:formylglycine-generating enzyme required for sulfatase activity
MRLGLAALFLWLVVALPALAQSPDDAAANRLFVEAVKARDEAGALDPGEADIAAWTRKRDLLVQVERNLRDIVDRHAGSGLAVRLILKEDIGGQMSLLRAAREAASAREGLEISQDVVAARRALDALEPSLARARGLSDPGERFAELQRLRPQLADIGRRHPRARQAASALRALETEITALSEAILIAAVRRVLSEIEPSLARAREIADPSMRLAELQRLRPQLAAIAERHARVQQAVAALRALDTEIERLAAEIAAVAAAASFKSINDAAGIGRVLRDRPECPEVVVVPAGATRLASGRDVTIAAPFAVGKFEVTFAEWDACVVGGGCTHRPADRGWGRGRQPVMNVSWDDAQQYVAWLSRTTGKTYRLLSEAEWEYAAQAGSGREQAAQRGANQANCDGCGSRWDNKQTAPVGSFAANAFGLHDMLGNVWEWTADCWNESHAGAASDGSARMSGECSRRVLRGGSWRSFPGGTRSAYRDTYPSDFRFVFYGFRVARTL